MTKDIMENAMESCYISRGCRRGVSLVIGQAKICPFCHEPRFLSLVSQNFLLVQICWYYCNI